MPKLSEDNIERVYWSISQMADEMCISPASLRDWTDKLKELKLCDRRSPHRDRRFNINQRRRTFYVRYLVIVRGFTLKGAMREIQEYGIPNDFKIEMALVSPIPKLRERRSMKYASI